MVEKSGKKDSNIVDFLPDPERSLANPAPVSRFDAAPNARRERKRKEAAAACSGVADDQPPPLDFTFHGPTANDIHVLKITVFASAMAVGIMILGFGIAAGLLKLV